MITGCGQRYTWLEELGMIWDAEDFAFAEQLAAARAYFADHRTLAAPRSATALDRAVGGTSPRVVDTFDPAP